MFAHSVEIIAFGSQSRSRVRLHAPHRPEPDGFVDIRLELEGDGLAADTMVRTMQGDGLAAWLGELAESFTGWRGTRRWDSLEADASILAEHDGHGHVTLRFVLRGPRGYQPDAWEASLVITLDAGENIRNWLERSRTCWRDDGGGSLRHRRDSVHEGVRGIEQDRVTGAGVLPRRHFGQLDHVLVAVLDGAAQDRRRDRGRAPGTLLCHPSVAGSEELAATMPASTCQAAAIVGRRCAGGDGQHQPGSRPVRIRTSVVSVAQGRAGLAGRTGSRVSFLLNRRSSSNVTLPINGGSSASAASQSARPVN